MENNKQYTKEEYKNVWYKAMTGEYPEEGKGLYWHLKNNPPKPIDLTKDNLIKIFKQLFNK